MAIDNTELYLGGRSSSSNKLKTGNQRIEQNLLERINKGEDEINKAYSVAVKSIEGDIGNLSHDCTITVEIKFKAMQRQI